MKSLTMEVGRFAITLRAREPITLPSYKGAALRGGFGHAFRKTVCAVGKTGCSDCLLKNQCVYSYVFETPPPPGTKIMRKYQKAPHPFVIEPPLEKKEGYKPGEELTFGLTLIGRAVDYLPYFIYTFEELGKMGLGRGKGKFELTKVRNIHDNGTKDSRIIYTSATRQLSPFETITLPLYIDITENKGKLSGSVTLDFITPTRITYNGHRALAPEIDFQTVIRQLLRRISLISYFHCGINISHWDFRGIIEAAGNVTVKENNLRWYDWERYSGRQDRRIKMGGFTGSIRFSGNTKLFDSLLKAGEALHLGKYTAFGMGKYITNEMQYIEP